ncbi:MAG: hypothetical protein EAX96_06945 [Candidatus Lokiarchaeota archaeon]|nr:hypothetical protein [Candidatus Lokiarchaeota archaeon]
MDMIELIDNKDEHLHKPQNIPYWRESYYFNAMDPKNNIFTVSTMGYMPYEKTSHYFSVLYIDDKLYSHVGFQKLNNENDIRENPTDGKSSFKLIKEHDEWNVKLKKRNFEMDYSWKARFPVFEYIGGWKIPNILVQEHYEQSGTVKGTIKMKDGSLREINGFGHRDHSWGVRDWIYIDNWYWTSVQFEDGKMALNCWLNLIGGKKYMHGFISIKNKNIAIKNIEVETKIKQNNPNQPQSAIFTLIDENKKEYSLKAETKYLMTLPQSYKDGIAYVNETISKFEMNGEVGYGVAEYLRSERKK